MFIFSYIIASNYVKLRFASTNSKRHLQVITVSKTKESIICETELIFVFPNLVPG
jgi:hypothetical protein